MSKRTAATAKHDVNVNEIAATSEVSRLLAEDKVPCVLNGLEAVDRWQAHFDYPSSATLGLVSVSISIGSVAAVPVIPYCNDRRGRKFSVIFGSFIVLIGVVIQTAAVNLRMLIASRTIIGFGLVICLSGAAQLLTELCYPKERAVMGHSFNWPNEWSWRLPTLFQILPSLLQISFIWFVPESPRWLISRDRHDEALHILTKYHGEGDPDSAFVAAEFLQIRETLRLKKDASSSPWRELINTKANLCRVTVAFCVGLFLQWAGNGLVSYYLAKVLTSIGIESRLTQNQINLLTGFGSMCVIFSCWTASSAVFANSTDANGENGNNSAATAVVALIFIYYAFYNLMMPLQYLYVSEVFPFLQRSKGIAIMQFSNKGGTGFNQFVNPIGLEELGWRYYLVYVVILAVETGVIWLFYPETRGVSFKEVAVVMEGDRARVERVEGKREKAEGDV
ncbi:general substrate transporter [Aspergillus crustosus]